MSGILIVVAPHLIASSTVLHKKSGFVLVPSSGDHSTSSVNFFAKETLSLINSKTSFGDFFNLNFICKSLVEIKVCIL